MDPLETINGKIEELRQKRKDYNSWQSRYERLKNSENNKKARRSFQKLLSKTYAEQELTEEQEAIVFSQAFEQLFLKNPAATSFPDFDEYEVEKTENTYIVKGFCDSTNSYGAQMRGKYDFEVYKCDGEWTCITDVGARYLKWILLSVLIISLPTIVACCSIASY